MTVGLNAVVLLSCYGAAQGLRVSVTSGGPGWMPQPNGRLPGRLYGKFPLAATAVYSMSSESSSSSNGRSSRSSSPSNAAPLGFGSRASRRKKGGINRRKRGGADNDSVPPVVVLKRSSRWACVKGCGACCYLAPDERPDLAEYLPDKEEFDLYLSMAADDGWCKHFDKENRACTIYNDRPRFCRVETETFGEMYGVEPEDMDDFCSSCCNEQIDDVYGGKSKEMKVFKAALAALERGERPNPDLRPFGGDVPGGEQIRDWGLEEEPSDAVVVNR